MISVRDKRVWCPTYPEIKLRACPNPPTKAILINEVQKLAEMNGKDMGIQDNRIPNKSWLINVLSTLAPDHLIFKKDYLPPVKPVKKEDKVVDNND
jgi:hypothetical protein